MKKYIKQVKKGLAALMAAVLVLGSGIVPAAAAVYADEPPNGVVYVLGATNMAITADGGLWAWGDNHFGQLGDGTTTDRHSPVRIMENVASVFAGRSSTFAIQTDGSLWAWGSNVNGTLGDGTTTNRHSPVKIMENVASAISATDSIAGTFAIQTDGSLWAWGFNGGGQLGDGTTTHRYSPVKIMGNVASVSLVDFVGRHPSTFAIQTDGSLWAWGNNENGRLGDGTTTNRRSPVRIMENVASVFAGRSSTFAIQTDGSLWAWGSNASGQLGDGTGTHRHNPVRVMENVASVLNFFDYTFAIQTDGSLWAWGFNGGGQLGDGTTTHRRNPVRIMDNVAYITSMHQVTYAIQTDGSLWSWGTGQFIGRGSMGNGTNTGSNSPVRIMGNVASVAVDTRNNSAAYAIQTDGSLWAWGWRGMRGNQLGDGTNLANNSYSPVRILENVASVMPHRSGSHASIFAIQADGSLWAWGNNTFGRLGDGTNIDRFSPVRVNID